MTATLRASVVVPLYNDAATIGPCLDSIKAQNIAERLEIIVVDDGSADNGVAIAERRAVRLLRQANAGPAAARNAGARVAQAPVVLFLDADCTIPPHWAETMVAVFADSRVVAAMGTLVSASEHPLALLVQSELEERYALLRRFENIDFIASVSCGVRREHFIASRGFNEAFRYNEDVELAYRFSTEGGMIRLVEGAPAAHPHPTSWGEYSQTKFWRGVWRMRLYRLYPQKAVRDTWTPQTLKLQIVGCYAMVPELLLAVLDARWLLACLLTWLAVMLSAWRPVTAGIKRLWRRRGPLALFWTVGFVMARALALGAAVFYDAVHRKHRVPALRGIG